MSQCQRTIEPTTIGPRLRRPHYVVERWSMGAWQTLHSTGVQAGSIEFFESARAMNPHAKFRRITVHDETE